MLYRYRVILKADVFTSLPGSNLCELSCLALGHNFYYNFGHVLDGTSCDKEPGAVCVNGRCLVSSNITECVC